MKTIHLTPTQISLAHKAGIPITEYAKHLAKQLAERHNLATDVEDDEHDEHDEYDDPNKQDIMNAPIKTLRSMWEVKFGYRWLFIDELDKQEMDDWSRIEGRLKQYQMFEEYDNWLKLKEEL